MCVSLGVCQWSVSGEVDTSDYAHALFKTSRTTVDQASQEHITRRYMHGVLEPRLLQHFKVGLSHQLAPTGLGRRFCICITSILCGIASSISASPRLSFADDVSSLFPSFVIYLSDIPIFEACDWLHFLRSSCSGGSPKSCNYVRKLCKILMFQLG